MILILKGMLNTILLITLHILYFLSFALVYKFFTKYKFAISDGVDK